MRHRRHNRSRLVPDAGPLVLAGLLALAGCGQRPVPLAADGQASTDASPTRRDAFQPDADPWQPPLPASGCVVAIRVDDCCTAPMPAPVQMVKADPCLVLWPPTNIPPACAAKWPEACAYTDCAYSPPISRLARAVPGGTCAWASECTSHDDCIPTLNTRECCGCPTAYPKVLVDLDPCLCDARLNMPCPAQCAKNCDAVKCKSCDEWPQISCIGSWEDPGIKVCSPW